MNERANELIKSIPDLKYDASTGLFETDRRALYDLVELTIRECVQFIEEENVRLCEYQNSLPEWDGNKRDDCDLVIEKCIDLAERLKEHFGVEE